MTPWDLKTNHGPSKESHEEIPTLTVIFGSLERGSSVSETVNDTTRSVRCLPMSVWAGFSDTWERMRWRVCRVRSSASPRELITRLAVAMSLAVAVSPAVTAVAGELGLDVFADVQCPT